MHIKRETYKLFPIFGTLILSQIFVIFISMFYSFPHFLLSFVFFMREKLNYSLVFLLACSSFSSKQFHHSTKMKSSWETNVNVNRKLLFCVFQRNFHQSSLFRFLFLLWISLLWFGVWICCICQLLFTFFSRCFSI